ncbi:MAG: NAD(P)-binding domain-containing protein, partial [Candidatus Syntrophosphaera sp.]
MRAAIIGGGGWGLALSKLLRENQHDVIIWEFNPRHLETLQKNRSNPILLPSVKLPDGIVFTGSFAEIAAFKAQIVILATPSQFLRATLGAIEPPVARDIW